MITKTRLHIFLAYAGVRFQRLQVWRLHVFSTLGIVVGGFIGWLLTGNKNALAYNILTAAIVNVVITVSHYASSWHWWKKDGH